jgi:putative transcriptional regulator
MPIIVKLDDVLYERRMTLTELSERIGITLANLSILKTGKARAVRFSTLDSICQVLQCQPGDLLEFVPVVKSDDASAQAAAGDASKPNLHTSKDRRVTQ